MFFREKLSTKSKLPTLQLVQSIRKGKTVRQKIIASLGVGFDIPTQDRKLVATLVRDSLSNAPSLFEPKITIAKIAARVVKIIQTRRNWRTVKQKKKKVKKEPLPSKLKPKSEQKQKQEQKKKKNRAQVYEEKQKQGKELAQVYVDDVEHSNNRELGPLLIGHTFWQRLSFPRILSQCGFNNSQLSAAEVSVLNSLIAPASENTITDWIKTVAAEDIIDDHAEDWGKDRFYFIIDKLKHQQKYIEQQLYLRQRNLFNLQDSVYLYDLTNTYFEGKCLKNPQAEYSKNQKEKRSDCPQIVVALVLDQQGFIRRHFIFAGKKGDAKTLAEILKELEKDFDQAKLPTIIMDRGVSSQNNIDLLNKKQLKYIIASRSSEVDKHKKDFRQQDFKVIRHSDEKGKVEIYLKSTADENIL